MTNSINSPLLLAEQTTAAWLKRDVSRCNTEHVFPFAGFLLIKQQSENSSRFKGCTWTRTTQWRRPCSSIYRYSDHLKHEDIYSLFSSLHHIYYTLDSHNNNNYVLQTKTSSVHRQAHCCRQNRSKSKKVCEQWNNWNGLWLRRANLFGWLGEASSGFGE